MTTKDSTVVRLPNALVARIDRARGQMTRAAYIAALLDRGPLRPTLPMTETLHRTEVTPRFKKGKP